MTLQGAVYFNRRPNCESGIAFLPFFAIPLAWTGSSQSAFGLGLSGAFCLWKQFQQFDFPSQAVKSSVGLAGFQAVQADGTRNEIRQLQTR
ncbi:hypothetical protein [Asticcacaulis sp. MM231]|uniref:hypothetical protein n=1 Tax=Asticcacaulis sp. MM231 TaxID=3157666 RepID=UPI0032D5747D